MEGLLRRRIPLLLRRTITLIPALVVLAIGVDPTQALVISQVVLSFGIPFALIPLFRLTSQRTVMGEATNHKATIAASCLVVTAVVALNLSCFTSPTEPPGQAVPRARSELQQTPPADPQVVGPTGSPVGVSMPPRPGGLARRSLPSSGSH